MPMITIRSHHEREINHIATGMSPQPRWRTTPSSSWEREMAMKMAPVLMKMAPGAIPRPGRVPERSFCPPNLDFGAAAARNLSGSLVNIFSVYSAGLFMVERAAPEGSRGGLATTRRGRILIWTSRLVGPLQASSELRLG